MSGYARPVLASQGRLAPGVILVEKPFSEADLMAKAGQVLNGHFQDFKTTRGRRLTGTKEYPIRRGNRLWTRRAAEPDGATSADALSYRYFFQEGLSHE
jgi:hypothetical protein